MKTFKRVYILMALLVATSLYAADKTFIDYFLPMPIESHLVSDVWGAPGVFPRDPKNGLEDETMKQWNYWDGQIIKGPEGKYHIFASRWDQAQGHRGWWGSLAVHAVSDKVTGPYVDKGLCWPENQAGKGHNVTALVLPDGRYVVVVSETRPGDVFVSKSLDGPWEHLGSIKVAENEFSRGGRMSNVSIMVRPDGDFMIVPRSGAILISKDGILGPYVVQGPSVYSTIPEMSAMRTLEDPVVWYSGGLYHIVVNNWNPRKAYHITSVDGIHNWTFRGLAYDPTTDFVRYTDGTINHWFKLERPGVVIENGHVTAVSLAVLDVPKNEERGNDTHGSKIIVVPFDGAALDRDLHNLSNTTQPGETSGRLAAKPLFRDPVYDGAADPVLCWNQAQGKWFMFYTNRRANEPNTPGVTWVHGTHIGIAESSDGGATWKYKTTADIDYGRGEYSYWAPEVIEHNGTYHMYLTFVPGIFADWNAPRDIIHLTSRDMLKWKYESTLKLSSNRSIDACVMRLADGTWRMWYNNEVDGKSIYCADSNDLFTWRDRGKVIGDRSGEGPKVFRWKDRYWMVVDVWDGLGIYSSNDCRKWTRQKSNLLRGPGQIPTDRAKGGHPDVVVSGGRAFLFYFIHQGGRDAEPNDPYARRRSLIQVVELEYKAGEIVCDRNKPTYIRLLPKKP